MAARHASLLSRAQQQRIQPAQFFFEQPGRGVFGFALQRIAANQFRQPVRFVRGRGAHRAHFRQHAIVAGARNLPGRLATRQAAAENVDGTH